MSAGNGLKRKVGTRRPTVLELETILNETARRLSLLAMFDRDERADVGVDLNITDALDAGAPMWTESAAQAFAAFDLLGIPDEKRALSARELRPWVPSSMDEFGLLGWHLSRWRPRGTP